MIGGQIECHRHHCKHYLMKSGSKKIHIKNGGFCIEKTHYIIFINLYTIIKNIIFGHNEKITNLNGI